MCDRWETCLAGVSLATVLVCLWLVAIDDYARSFLDAAFFQFICFAEPVQDLVTRHVV